MTRSHLALLVSLVGLVPGTPALAVAQRQPAAARWWHGAVLLGGLSALALLDEPARELVQAQRSAETNRVADAVRPLGEAKVTLALAGGLAAAGLLSGDSRLTRAGNRLVATFGLTVLGAQAAKVALGRARPGSGSGRDADDFSPFSGRSAMPSGHTTVAFALATELADNLERPWATAGLYTLATAVGWSRMNDDRHWLTDVGAGAVLGIAAAKLVDGRWRIFNVRPPYATAGFRGFDVGWRTSW